MYWLNRRLLVNLSFFQVFDAYAQFEESMISAKMETTSEMVPSEEGAFLL